MLLTQDQLFKVHQILKTYRNAIKKEKIESSAKRTKTQDKRHDYLDFLYRLFKAQHEFSQLPQVIKWAIKRAFVTISNSYSIDEIITEISEIIITIHENDPNFFILSDTEVVLDWISELNMNSPEDEILANSVFYEPHEEGNDANSDDDVSIVDLFASPPQQSLDQEQQEDQLTQDLFASQPTENASIADLFATSQAAVDVKPISDTPIPPSGICEIHNFHHNIA